MADINLKIKMGALYNISHSIREKNKTKGEVVKK